MHGLSHRVWTDLSSRELQQEVSGSIHWLSCLGHFKPSAICMPHGKINSRVYQALETYGLPLVGVDHKYKQPVIRRSWVKEKQE
ncbi:polysaccharide deacetylase family protein [Marinobacter sp. HL-58]|uniref:polysaccharide deacetylase family protein n=1 Tax=Marinobacter sp. HL-58 TaxID=1479237 RepID=UPI00345C589A